MMERLKESKWVYILISILLALVFWLYVRAEVNPSGTITLRNVPVQLSGVSVLTQQGLTVSNLSADTVTLRLEAPASVQDDLTSTGTTYRWFWTSPGARRGRTACAMRSAIPRMSTRTAL